MLPDHRFPFGGPLRLVVQQDRRPKLVFVLGVYASAVHARWIGPDGKDCVRALAVAAEPYIFWRGDGTQAVIDQIDIPAQAGRLVPAAPELNGPSGIALDELFLNPLGFSRNDAWLCDLVPHSCVNPSQQRAIERAYLPLVDALGLPKPTIPPVPKVLADDQRRQEIVEEIIESDARLLVLLGDQPIRWFLRYFDARWSRLGDFSPYGQRQPTNIRGRDIDVLALAHPRQVAKLGRSSEHWYQAHQQWLRVASPQPT
jgi:hypothetical protein